MRSSTSTFPIRPSLCRSARARFNLSVTATGYTWAHWLVDDQREASGRPDVLAFVSDTLQAPVKISGQPMVNLMASTSGTDSDWVVKLIDVYPDEVAGQAAMGGYQLMVSADIFRGRYRESFGDSPKPSPPTSRCRTTSRCRRPIMFFCRDTRSWCRSSRAGSRSTTATRRRSFPISSGRNQGTIGRLYSGSTTRPVKLALSNCRWSRRLKRLQHSAGLHFEDRQRFLKLVNGLPDFGMFSDLALQSLE